MRDPSNPTPAELLEWAYDPDADCDEDFDLIVATPENAELLLRVADDDQCPKQLFFLDCLYRLVGAVAATDGRFMSESQIRRLIDRGTTGASASLRRWADRAAVLLADPHTFDQSTWQDGGWALDDDVWRDENTE
jgi:hypothetical protein